MEVDLGRSGPAIEAVLQLPEKIHQTTKLLNEEFLQPEIILEKYNYKESDILQLQGSPGQPQDLGRNISMWMLLERVRFTLDGIECNKIGVSYEAFNQQPNFCSSPFWTCLHNQLWNFREADLNRISRNQVPLYGLEGRFERINQHPSAGSYSFSIGITEVLNTNLVLELSVNDVEYVYQRIPGKIISVSVPTFEALTQFGVATITTKNTGEFNCSKDITLMEKFVFCPFLFYTFIGLLNEVTTQSCKPNEVTTQSCKIYPSTDQASKYFCAGKVEALDLYVVIYSEDKEHINIYCPVLKDSDYNEVDRAECQFATTTTVLDNDTKGMPFQPPEASINSFFDFIASIWNKIWTSLTEFITGKTYRYYLQRYFSFAMLVLLWLLRQKGLFDPLYDWWEDILGANEQTSWIKNRIS
ncbi:Protein HAPLESS 2 [Glycine max]|nr:Protein HAPLESS 2 [Glycine max]